jgi:hypothetical protein
MCVHLDEGDRPRCVVYPEWAGACYSWPITPARMSTPSAMACSLTAA